MKGDKEEEEKIINIYGMHDKGTLQQFFHVIEQENVVSAALMPDGHFGYTMPIGGVALVKGAVYPSWVGYDIGCGVCAIRVRMDVANILTAVKQLRDLIALAVPTKEHRSASKACSIGGLTKAGRDIAASRHCYKQMGTLGGGNHFIEMDYDEDDGSVWIVIHSGSRGAGHGIAGYYMKKAKEMGDGTDMSCFQYGTPEYKDYMNDQKWATEYALANRVEMLKAIEKETGLELEWDTLINKVHNEAKEVQGVGWVLHRKGATSAHKGEDGVIPGNCRDGSVIVKGLGNEGSLYSCSHGAGRTMGRGEAKRKLSLETYQLGMNGIESGASIHNIDESPEAYKDFDDVMAQQSDLCQVVRTLRPMINYKG